MASVVQVPQPVNRFPVNSVVKVGDGRGFITQYRVKVAKLPQLEGLRLRKFMKQRAIITAAHCLPKLPPAHRGSFFHERTYAKLVSSLDGSQKDIWTECLFVDPVSDIAVLSCPDAEELGDETDAFIELVERAPALRIGALRSGAGWVLSLDGSWIPTHLDVFESIYGISLSIDPTRPGMSGSPILDDEGRAVGIVAIGGLKIRNDRKSEGPQPILMNDLPRRFLPRA